MEMAWEQVELFAIATEEEIQRTKFLLAKYVDMTAIIEDFELYERDLAQVGSEGEVARRIDDEELYADKTANAVILNEKQKWVYKQYKAHTQMLERAVRMIRDGDARKAVEARYFDGKSRKQLIQSIYGLSESTVDRRLEEGVLTVANTLKVLGFFERDNRAKF